MPAARVVHILRQVCESLEEAHDAGLVHRDIKPANIHLGRVGCQPDFVKVLDFGLVKSVDGHRTATTRSPASLGSRSARRPTWRRRWCTASGGVDGRADLYSLGCVAYYLLTGQLVFEGADRDPDRALHVQQPPVPPSARTDNPIPPALERLVLACLAKQPEDRPQSAAELATRPRRGGRSERLAARTAGPVSG